MAQSYVVYGQRGTGSVPVEAALMLLGQPFELREPSPPGVTAADGLDEEAYARINPMRQLPALVLPDGRLMTESAAILIHLADSHPAGGLSPAAADPARPDFLRWMVFVAAQIYGQVWARDDLGRLAADEPHKEVIRARTAERMAQCWAMMDAQVTPGRYILGDTLTVLDLYVTVVSHWGPRRARFYREAPKMTEVVRRVDSDPRLAEFWTRRM